MLVSQPGQISLFAIDGRLVWSRELQKSKVLMGLVTASDVVAFGIAGQVRQIDSVGRE